MNNFNYNSFFYPNYNIFNSNIDYRQIGIGGVKTPNGLIDIYGNVNTERLNITGNINYNENITSSIKILQQTNTGLLKNKELKNTNSEWILKNNELELILKGEDFNDELYYYSDIYDLDTNGDCEINIQTQTQLKLTYIYVDADYGNNLSLVPQNLSVTINNINYNSTLINGTTTLYKLDDLIILTNTLNKLNCININDYIKKIQIIGNYISFGSSLWKLLSYDLYINNNIGIFTNNPTSNLHINGNMYIRENLVINNNIKCIDLNSDNLIVENLNITNIESISNNLYINNSNKKPINIGNSINNNQGDILNIHNNFIINNDYIKSNYLNIKNNINIHNSIKSSNLNIKFNNNEIIYTDNTNNNLLLDNNKQVYIKNKLNIISNDNDNNYKLCVDGNIYIDGDLELNNNPFQTQTIINTGNNDIINDILESNYISLISNNINVINNINSNILKINEDLILFNLNTYSNTIYFDNINNKFMFKNYYNQIKEIKTSETVDENIQNGIYTNLIVNDIFKINNQSIYMNGNIQREELIVNNNIKRFHMSY